MLHLQKRNLVLRKCRVQRQPRPVLSEALFLQSYTHRLPAFFYTTRTPDFRKIACIFRAALNFPKPPEAAFVSTIPSGIGAYSLLRMKEINDL